MAKATEIFLDGLRKQSFSVILTLAGLAALAWWNLRERADCQASISALEIEMDSCAAKREAMSIEVARLREKLDLLASAESPRRKR